jgi:hypothetical protein
MFNDCFHSKFSETFLFSVFMLDDTGVFDTSLSWEYIHISTAYGVSMQDLLTLSCNNHFLRFIIRDYTFSIVKCFMLNIQIRVSTLYLIPLKKQRLKLYNCLSVKQVFSVFGETSCWKVVCLSFGIGLLCDLR